jgi:hypothetical protein
VGIDPSNCELRSFKPTHDRTRLINRRAAIRNAGKERDKGKIMNIEENPNAPTSETTPDAVINVD